MNNTETTLNKSFRQSLVTLIDEGALYNIRGTDRVEKIPHQFCITEPTKRVLSCPYRYNNVFATFAELIWVFSGRNDMEWLGEFLPNAYNFSDDGKIWNGAYGPRLKSFHGIQRDGEKRVVDQIENVISILQADPFSTQAVMTIYEPNHDQWIGGTKDTPCTMHIQFFIRDNKLHTHCAMRSNDCFVYGTKIKLLNGETKELGWLAENRSDETFWVYSCDENNQIAPGLAHHPRKVKEVTELVEIELDNGYKERCTPDHRWELRNGSYKEAQNLQLNESLMPLYPAFIEKVKSVKRIKLEKPIAVYDLTVDEHHNFALESGVFVHNCLWGCYNINIVEWVFLQEILASILKVEVGEYHHTAGSFHYYTTMQKRIDNILSIPCFDIYDHIDPTPIDNIGTLYRFYNDVQIAATLIKHNIERAKRGEKIVFTETGADSSILSKYIIGMVQMSEIYLSAKYEENHYRTFIKLFDSKFIPEDLKIAGMEYLIRLFGKEKDKYLSSYKSMVENKYPLNFNGSDIYNYIVGNWERLNG